LAHPNSPSASSPGGVYMNKGEIERQRERGTERQKCVCV